MPLKNELLLKQLEKFSLRREALPSSLKEWNDFLDRVAMTYKGAEEDRYLLERSLNISSAEMRQNYDKIKSLNSELSGRNKVLHGLLDDKPISEVIIEILKYVEAQADDLRATIDILDVQAEKRRSLTGALSKDFVDGLTQALPSCEGRAPLLQVIESEQSLCIENIQTSDCNPLFKEITQKWSLSACWSYPIFDHKQQLRAVLTVYSLTSGLPSKELSDFLSSQISAMKLAYKLDEIRGFAARDRVRMINSAKLASLGEMAAGLAHEINNPLAVISGHANNLDYLIEQAEIDRKELAESCKVIERSVERIAKIITSLRHFSADVAVDRIESVAINDIVKSTLDLCAVKFGKLGGQVTLKLTSDDVKIICNSSEISQAIFHLVQNAYEAVKDVPDKWVRVEVDTAVDYVFVTVIDSGVKISKAVNEKLFEPFYTTKSVGEGQGLGLSVCRGIAESYGGKVTFEAAKENTTFSLLLPIDTSVAAGKLTNAKARAS